MRFNLSLLFFLTLSSHQLFALSFNGAAALKYLRSQNPSYTDGGIYNTPYSISDFKTDIKENHLTTPEQTLTFLKSKRPQMFKNYVLMYRSRSLQNSSFSHPRAILYDPQGTLFLSFNGDPKHSGFKELEVMDFNPQTARFAFHEISFDGNKSGQVSRANPKKCMQCHQSVYRKTIDPRPNWEPYNIWPGAYGSNSGRLGPFSQSQFDHRVQANKDQLLIEEQQQEKSQYEKFEKNIKPHHSRYSLLEDFSPHETVEMTVNLSHINLMRTLRIMTEDYSPLWEKFKYPLYAIARCDKLAISQASLTMLQKNQKPVGFVDINDRPSYKPQPLFEYAQLNGHRTGGGRYDHDSSLSQAAAYKAELESPLRMRFSKAIDLLFSPYGVSTHDWSMDFETNARHAFSERFGSPVNVGKEFYGILKHFYTDEFKQLDSLNCNHLNDYLLENSKSLELDISKNTLPHFNELDEYFSQQNSLPFLKQRCIQCHDSGSAKIPQISFTDEDQLSRELLKPSATMPGKTLIEAVRFRLSSYASYREAMPLGTPVSRELKDELLEYLDSLVEEPQ